MPAPVLYMQTSPSSDPEARTAGCVGWKSTCATELIRGQKSRPVRVQSTTEQMRVPFVHSNEVVGAYLGDEVGVRVSVLPQRRRGPPRVKEVDVVPGLRHEVRQFDISADGTGTRAAWRHRNTPA